MTEDRKRNMTFEEAIESMRRQGIEVSVNDPTKRPKGNAEIIASPRKEFREFYSERRAREEQGEEEVR